MAGGIHRLGRHGAYIRLLARFLNTEQLEGHLYVPAIILQCRFIVQVVTEKYAKVQKSWGSSLLLRFFITSTKVIFFFPEFQSNLGNGGGQKTDGNYRRNRLYQDYQHLVRDLILLRNSRALTFYQDYQTPDGKLVNGTLQGCLYKRLAQ